MTDTTPRASLPELAAAQAQKHVTHNEALLQIDALFGCRILDRDLTTPPGSPADGDAYIVKATGTGAWTGQDAKIAFALDGAWRFYAPFAGLTAYIADDAEYLIYNGTAWVDLSSVLSLENLPMLGVNTTADATNKLAVASSAVLLTNVGASIQAFINKHASGDTASFLFETNFSGRAEIGLTGDDNFHFKVSPDGSTWYEGLQIDRNTGSLLLKHIDVTGTTTIGATHLGRIVRADATSGAFNVTLPASADTDDWVIVRKKDSGTNRVTVKDNSGNDVAWLSARHDEAMFAWWDGAWSPVRWKISPLFQAFTSSGTYTKPPLAQKLDVMAIGGAAGGGSGRRGAVGTARFGGGGSAAAGVGVIVGLLASDVGATETVTIGAGGNGGAAVTSDDTNGNAGAAGGVSNFGAFIRGGNTGAGAGGTNAAGAGSGSQSTITNWGSVGAGGNSSSSAAGAAGAAGAVGAGGAGGGISTGDTAFAGGAGGNGSFFRNTFTTGGSAGAVGSSGTVGADVSNSRNYVGGAGGGGGGASTSGAAGAGANGGIPGGGGAGGGASLNGNNSGAGGNGARGEVRVMTYF